MLRPGLHSGSVAAASRAEKCEVARLASMEGNLATGRGTLDPRSVRTEARTLLPGRLTPAPSPIGLGRMGDPRGFGGSTNRTAGRSGLSGQPGECPGERQSSLQPLDPDSGPDRHVKGKNEGRVRASRGFLLLSRKCWPLSGKAFSGRCRNIHPVMGIVRPTPEGHRCRPRGAGSPRKQRASPGKSNQTDPAGL